MCPSWPVTPSPGGGGHFFVRAVTCACTLKGVADELTCEQARLAMARAREACLAAIGNCYGHPASATPPDVLAAVNALSRLAFDAGAEYTRASTPPPPSDPEIMSAAETLVRAALRPRSG